MSPANLNLPDKSYFKSIRACTLFDSNFLAQGLALIESVETYSSCNVLWTILALDETSFSFLESLDRPNLEVIHLEKFADAELQSLKFERAWKEFCWTSAACLLNFCLSQSPSGQTVAYIDADCYFFGDINAILRPLLTGSKIVIHEHRFSPDRIDWLNRSGRFNVGLVAGVNEIEFKTCVEKWRGQVLECCDVNFLEGRCGDQTYLNEWPDLYPSLHILTIPGAGLAPWNIKNYSISAINGKIEVDSKQLYFYHFSGLEFIYFSRVLALFIPASGYLNMTGKERVIYFYYVKHLMQIFSSLGTKPRKAFKLNYLIKNLLRGKVDLQIGRF